VDPAVVRGIQTSLQLCLGPREASLEAQAHGEVPMCPLQDYLDDSSYPLSAITVGKSFGLRLGNAQENEVKQEPLN